MPKASSSTRLPLPASSSDFALPAASSLPSITLDDPASLFHRFRKPSLLQKGGYLTDSRLHSPLASSFTFHSRRRSRSAHREDNEPERDRMMTDSPSSSETHTPPLRGSSNCEEDPATVKPPVRQHPLTPPRRKSSASMDALDMPTIFNRRLSFPLKQPRILNLLAESRPDEAELKSEAAFQRLVASVSDLPAQPRTPRTLIDRGRYPEEAGQEEPTREDTPSDDEPEDGPFAFNPPATGTQPITIKRPRTITPSCSVAGSINGDDAGMSASETSSSFGGVAMDVDMPLGSPLLPAMTPIAHWRYTPPPTASAVRSNKRKLDDRFDPYPSAAKRRAVSPSLAHLRESHSSTSSPIMRTSGSRLPVSIPITIPPSTVNSAASSPTISSMSAFHRTIPISSSPTMRGSLSLTMASPILRPIGRRPAREEELEEREIQGAGDAVNGLSLGPSLNSSADSNSLIKNPSAL